MFLKKHSKFILILFLLVAFQVFCDFTIPNYAYKLIDTGIVNEGVNDTVPAVIRRSSMKELTNFMTKEEKKKVLDSYSFVNKKYEIYMKKYPVLKNEAIYILNGDRDSDLEGILENAILLMVNEEYSEIKEIVPKMIMGEGETLKNSFNRLSEKDKEVFIKQFSDNKKDVEKLTINDCINNYIKREYKEVGLKLSSIKNKYLTLTSIKIVALFTLKIIIMVYILKKVLNISLYSTKSLSKEILDKTSKLTYDEIVKRDVKSLITKNSKDIHNLPILVFTSLQMLFYIIIFSLLFVIVFERTFSSLNSLKFSIVEIFVILLILLIGYVILKKVKNKKQDKSLLVISYYVLAISISVLLLITVITGVVLSCLNINYISSLDLNIGEISVLAGYTLEMFIVIVILILSIFAIYRIVKSAMKIDNIMKSDGYIREPDKPKKFRKNAKHFVEFKSVGYKKTREKDVSLSNVSFKVNANSIFGILCSNLEECNLITRLLLKLDNLKDGNIVIDGIDINNVEINDLRTKIYCFYPKNVWYYEEDLESTKFLKSPDVYVLNDFNNDLDLESNEALNYFITKKAKNKMIIIISTNINNLRSADKLAVIDNGKLVGLGKHKELIKTCKEYKLKETGSQ